jgi:hypothetical protein
MMSARAAEVWAGLGGPTNYGHKVDTAIKLAVGVVGR